MGWAISTSGTERRASRRSHPPLNPQSKKTRRTTFSDDDIYTPQAMSCGCKVHGVERPASDTDTFVAP
jgi:hypothetical protein